MLHELKSSKIFITLKLLNQFQKFLYYRIEGGRNSQIENILSVFRKGEVTNKLE